MPKVSVGLGDRENSPVSERARPPPLHLATRLLARVQKPPQEKKTGMGKCKIICSFDGQEPEPTLYGKYVELSRRAFHDERYALVVQSYLAKRSARIQWRFGLPNYQIVPADEE